MLRGGAPDLVASEVDAIVAAWREAVAEDPKAMGEELAECCAALGDGVDAAREQIDDIDTSDKAGMIQGNKSLAALVAARDAMSRATAAFGSA